MGRHLVVVTVVLAVVAGACSAAEPGPPEGAVTVVDESGQPVVDEFGCPVVESPPPEALPPGEVVERPDEGNGHRRCPLGYVESPPASGDHFDAWQNCGFYSAPVRDETAVHSLEHGVVWISFVPDLDPDEVAAIESLATSVDHVLAAPYPGLANPIVLTAWRRHLAVDHIAHPAVADFLDLYATRRTPTAPEAGASCSGAVGVPPDQPDAFYAEIVASLG